MKSPSTHSESAGTGCQANAAGQYCLSYQKTLTQFGKSLLLSILLALLFFLSLKTNVKKFLADTENSDIVNGSWRPKNNWRRGAVSLQNPFGKTHTQNAGEKPLLMFSVIFLVSPLCLVSVINQRECVRTTWVWTQERMEVYLRNLNVSPIEKAVHTLPNIINLLITSLLEYF